MFMLIVSKRELFFERDALKQICSHPLQELVLLDEHQGRHPGGRHYLHQCQHPYQDDWYRSGQSRQHQELRAVRQNYR